MNYYKKIPKNKRKKFSRGVRKRLSKAILAFFIFPIIYTNRKKIFRKGLVKNNLHLKESNLYWYADNTEHIDGNSELALDFNSCWYGDSVNRINWLMKLGFIGKYFASLNWIVFRNSVTNLKLKHGQNLKGKRILREEIINIGDAHIFNWRDQKDEGIMCSLLTYSEDPNQEVVFMYSHTLPLGKFNPARILGYKWKNKMRGAGDNKWIYKNRYFRNLK